MQAELDLSVMNLDLADLARSDLHAVYASRGMIMSRISDLFTSSAALLQRVQPRDAAERQHEISR